MPGDTVELDGSGSTDPDGDELSYEWQQVSGPSVVLENADGPNPTFVAPEVERQAALVFRLVVNDAGDFFKTVPTPSSKSAPSELRIIVGPVQ